MTKTRFHTIDGLRGIAAMAVVFYHLAIPLDKAVGQQWLPAVMRWVVDRGYLGVDVFFVLSGFVIAYSTRNGDYSFSYLGRFALRRSIRLDPPYWLTIAAEITVVWLTLHFFTGFAPRTATVPQVISHLFYAQNIIGYGDILPIFWTLCYEIQFYVFFVLLLILRKRSGIEGRVAPVIMLTALFFTSLIIRYTSVDFPVQGIAIDRWFQFFLGVLTWWTVSKAIRVEVLAAAWVTVACSALLTGHGVEQFAALIACLVIAYAGLRDRMDTILAGRALQFLGKVSYSLYLVHLIVGSRLISLLLKLLPPVGVLGAWTLYMVGIAASVGSAAMMWRFVEQPTTVFSKRIKLKERKAVERVQHLEPAAVVLPRVAAGE